MNSCGRAVLTLAMAALAVLSSGCAHLATFQDKEVSYRQFESLNIKGETLGDYLQERTGILVGGARPVVIGGKPPGADIRLEPVAKDGFDIGSATAVTTDGYYLTAAHCVTRRPLYLMLASEAGAKIRVARLVWAPPARSPCDLAVLKIEADGGRAFACIDAKRIQPGLDIVTSGANGLAGGKVLRTDSSLVPAGPNWGAALAIVHSAPLAEGDSGGPLMTVDGQLAGVEVLARKIFFGEAEGIALLPDWRWLQATISRDRQAHRPASGPATQSAQGPGGRE